MKNKHKINPFWTYSRKERIGIAILTAGIICNAFLRWKNTQLLRAQLSQNIHVEYSFITNDSVPLKKQVLHPKSPTKPVYSKQKNYTKAVNLWSQEIDDLKNLGLSDSIAKRVHDNRSNYSKWRSLCAKDSLCRVLLDNKKIYYWVDQNKLQIEINEADSSSWKQLQGIGDKLSKRIVSYRAKLGGFYSKEQLKEVWGLKAETYQTIQDKLYVKKSPIKLKLSQNREEFVKHPYVPYPIKKKVSNYLNQPQSNLDSLTLSALPFMEDSVISKLSNYFYFE